MEPSDPIEVKNWEGSIAWHPRVVAQPSSVDDIVSIITDPDTYPSPVRAVGSRHSTTRCGVSDNGTVVDMTGMNRILEVGTDTVTAEAGALYIDVARELQKHDLQFFVNVELGNLSIGSAACGGTKDASMPGEFGQVSSYAIRIKMVTPSGELLEVGEDQPELLQVVRSSYGLFGIIYEVTFRVKPLRQMALRHVTYRLDEFVKELPDLTKRNESMMLYLFPFLDRVAVEFRKHVEGNGSPNRFIWRFRNYIWKNVAPGFGYLATKLIPIKAVRYLLIDRFNQMNLFMLHWLMKDRNTIPTDQIIRYPKKSNWTRYTFSIWAFPEDSYPDILRGYFDFCREHYREQGYRCNMLNVAYRIEKDTSALFSYSRDGTVLTLDPVSTGDRGWDGFLDAYNAFCSRQGGVPLFNQTKAIKPHQAKQAFGDRLNTFKEYRKRFDPTDRLLNAYFKEVLD